MQWDCTAVLHQRTRYWVILTLKIHLQHHWFHRLLPFIVRYLVTDRWTDNWGSIHWDSSVSHIYHINFFLLNYNYTKILLHFKRNYYFKYFPYHLEQPHLVSFSADSLMKLKTMYLSWGHIVPHCWENFGQNLTTITTIKVNRNFNGISYSTVYLEYKPVNNNFSKTVRTHIKY